MQAPQAETAHSDVGVASLVNALLQATVWWKQRPAIGRVRARLQSHAIGVIGHGGGPVRKDAFHPDILRQNIK